MQTIARYNLKITFKSLNSNYQKTLTFFIVPQITNLAPSEYVPRESLNIQSSLKLARSPLVTQ